MEIGMLWFDNSKDPLEKKVLRATEFYENKYGKAPNLCFIEKSPDNLESDSIMIGSIEIRATKTMIPNHYWIGIKSEREEIKNELC